MAGASKNTLTIFMYPWFALGHFIPYLLIANKLAERGHKIILIIPSKAQSKLAPLNHHPDLIEFRSISLPPVEGLPPHVETTNDATFEQKLLLLYALDLTQPIIESLLRELKPHLVFSDVMHWLPGLARRLKIKSVKYDIVSPAAVSLLVGEGELIESMKLSKHAARDLKNYESATELGSGGTIKQRIMTALCESDAICFKTCEEIEGEYCEFLANKLKKPILLTGPLIPKPRSDLILDQKWADWLDKFKPKTVIFCAFGSEAMLKKDQFEELLLGLELTGLPFLITLRPPLGVESIEEALPNGFKERNKERGIVYDGWVPQQLILKHPSVGCFVTHCGYGSMWEGLMLDCQLVALPHEGDQYVNARLMCENLKIAVEVEKGDEDGLFTKEGVHGAIMASMAEGSDIGKEVRENHDKLREFLVRKEFEDSYSDNFVEKLQSLVR